METLGCGSPWCTGSISNQRVIQVDTAPEFEVIVSSWPSADWFLGHWLLRLDEIIRPPQDSACVVLKWKNGPSDESS